MGGVKAQLDEGWSGSDAYICAACVTESALKDCLSEDMQSESPCSFCGGTPAAYFDTLLETFHEGLNHLYEDALNWVPYVSAEGGFVGAYTVDTWDLLEDFYDCFNDEVSELIISELRKCIDDRTWASRDDPDYGPEALLTAAWKSFCHDIKHDTRYVFWHGSRSQTTDDDPYGYGISPADALRRVCDLIDELGLFKTYEVGQSFFRSRTFSTDQDRPTTAKDLGTPPLKYSRQGNRMSPAGIPMFYASELPEVALNEVSVRTADDFAALAEFASTKQIKVVDLTRIPSMPSPFDPVGREQRWKVSFLEEFVESITKPIDKGQDQVEYVPTQVMTEYLLRIHWGRGGVQGLRYPSAAPGGGVSVVLDISSENCVEQTEADETKLQLTLRAHDLYRSNLSWKIDEGGAR